MKLATKKMPWVVASLAAVTSIFGDGQNQSQQSQDSCPQQPIVCRPPPRCGPLQSPLPPPTCAYNAPAEINTGLKGDVDIFGSASFLYWIPSQDNMAFAAVDQNQMGNLLTTGIGFRGAFKEFDYEYKPGFKVALGANLQRDDWDANVEYTSVHGKHIGHVTGSSLGPNVYATWGHPFLLASPGGVVGGGQVYQSAQASYRNNLDFIDAEVGRMYYVGKQLLFRPAVALRNAWILQNAHIQYTNETAAVINAATSTINAVPGYANVYARTHSWGIGPRVGLMMDYMLGTCLRFFGSGYGDILYTKYKVQDKTSLITRVNNGGLFIGQPIQVISFERVNGLRTHLDLELGLGWGKYFDLNNYHLDLSASYGFQVFFNQNMFRHFDNGSGLASNNAVPGNLYVQGLTFTARLDF